MASALGLNVGLVYVAAFAIGCFMAGLGGAIIVPSQAAVLGMGVDALILAFVVVVIGGLGSLQGALVGALIVSFVRTAGIQFFPEIELAVLYLIAALVLLIKPTGLVRDGMMTAGVAQISLSAEGDAGNRSGCRPHRSCPAAAVCRPLSDAAPDLWPDRRHRSARVQPAARLYRTVVVRPFRLLRHRRLYVAFLLRYARHHFNGALHSDRGSDRGAGVGLVRLYLRSPYANLLRHPDIGAVAGALQPCAQAVLGHRRHRWAARSAPHACSPACSHSPAAAPSSASFNPITTMCLASSRSAS